MSLKQKIEKLSQEIDFKKTKMQHLYTETRRSLKQKMLNPTVLMSSLIGGFLSVYSVSALLHTKKNIKRAKPKIPYQPNLKSSNSLLIASAIIQYLPVFIRYGRQFLESRRINRLPKPDQRNF